MNQTVKKLFIITLLTSAYSVNATYGKSFFLPLSQRGTAYNLINLEGKQHQHEVYETYSVLKTHVEYQQNFKNSDIGRYLFFNDKNTMQFGVADATNIDVSAVNFLLPLNYNGTTTINPKVQTVISDLSFNINLDRWVENLYINAHIPIIWTRHNIQLTETENTAALTNIPQNYLSATASGDASPYATISDAFKGDKVAGQVLQKWNYGRINGAHEKCSIGDAHLAFGYNFLSDETYHLGIEARGIISGGNPSTAETIFEPMIGNGGRHGIGIGLHGNYLLWEYDIDHNVTINASAHIDHFFNQTMRRSYDFTQAGIGSRYLLMEKMTLANPPVFANEIVNAINITSLRAQLNIPFTYDTTLMFTYKCDELEIEAGYEMRGQSKEKHNGWIDTIDYNTWAFNNHYGDNNSELTNIAGAILIANAIPTANNGLFASNDNLNIDSGLQPYSMSHTLFGAVNYTWTDSSMMPHVGIGGKAELACRNSTMSQWGVFSTMGICF